MTIDELRARASYHFAMADRQRRHAGFFSAFFGWTNPVLAAIITALISGKYGDFTEVALWLSLLLTILTVINATAKPSEDFRNSARYASLFWSFEKLLDLNIDEINSAKISEEDKRALSNAMLREKIVELESIVAGYNASFIPAQPVSGGRNDADGLLAKIAPGGWPGSKASPDGGRREHPAPSAG
jgi:hypothetical protein